jgi:ABC-type polysaccharide/polyol phosphate export permease
MVLGWEDFILKYRGSVLGYLWSLAGPIVRFLVILYVFGPLVHDTIPLYPLYLFLGIVIWEHFAVTTTGCMNMLFDKEGIIQRMPFPRILLIYAVGWTNLVIFISHLMIFFVFGLFMGLPLSWYLLELPLIMVQMSLIALGIGMGLAAYCLKYRDIAHMWNVGIQILFWLTPVMYRYAGRIAPWTALHEVFLRPGMKSLHLLVSSFVHTQPLAIIINNARSITLYPATSGTPTALHMIGLTLFCCIIFFIGKRLFDLRSPYFTQEY